MKIKYIISTLIISLFFGKVTGQLLPQLGGERAGISALTFLKLETSPATEAMSGAQISLPGDAYSATWNPATMTELTNKTIALSDRVMAAGIMNSYLSAIFPLKNRSAISFSLTNLNSGEIEKRTVYQPDGTGEIVYSSNLALGVSYAKVLSDFFSVGVGVKYVREQLAEFYANTVALDLGFLYKTDFKDLRFAVLLQNFGPNSSLGGTLPPTTFIPSGSETIDDYPVSGQFKMAISMVPYKTELKRLTVILQLNVPNDNAENIALGLDYCYNKIFFLRAGYKINVKDQTIPSVGFGLISRIGKNPLHIDYSVSTGNTLSLAHTLGVALYFNNQSRDEKR